MISMLASSERLNGCLFRRLINVLSNTTHENWSDVYVIHPKVIPDDSQERITTASSVFEFHTAKRRTRGLVATAKSVKDESILHNFWPRAFYHMLFHLRARETDLLWWGYLSLEACPFSPPPLDVVKANYIAGKCKEKGEMVLEWESGLMPCMVLWVQLGGRPVINSALSRPQCCKNIRPVGRVHFR